ncbi:MAG: HAMP domain-containing histidine kinase [Acidimicrobiia bacterium]|nr:HAMP domain-containing histidine kinase [Acidimicrobiia bacterium]
MRRPRPLDKVGSIKAKWSIVIVAAVGVTAVVSQVGYYLGWPVWIRPIISAALALIAVQFLAHGMTMPLRQMARGAREMATGDYKRRVTVTSADEVGQLAESFNRMAAELAEVDRAQKEFVANASHELRTPVAALRSHLENLVDHVSAPDPETLATMLAQAEHLSKLVVQLLDLSRLESTVEDRPGELVAVGVLLKQVVDEAELLHPASLISLTTSGPLGVLADESRLHQLFTNIIGNALRFAPMGSEVSVQAEGRDHDVVVMVRDQGPGIAPQDQARVFERFWQADGSALTGGGGAGLGLAICKRIVERHGGTIRITSNKPEGACVTVTLPSRPNP